jgi:hypothetical protein
VRGDERLDALCRPSRELLDRPDEPVEAVGATKARHDCELFFQVRREPGTGQDLSSPFAGRSGLVVAGVDRCRNHADRRLGRIVEDAIAYRVCGDWE